MRSLARRRVEYIGWTRSRFGYWDDTCPPQNTVQRAAASIDSAWDEAGEALRIAPGPIEELIQDKVRQARALLWEVRDHLQELDPQFCDGCGGRWTEDPTHEAQCEPNKFADDEHDLVREALADGRVYGPTPGPR